MGKLKPSKTLCHDTLTLVEKEKGSRRIILFKRKEGKKEEAEEEKEEESGDSVFCEGANSSWPSNRQVTESLLTPMKRRVLRYSQMLRYGKTDGKIKTKREKDSICCEGANSSSPSLCVVKQSLSENRKYKQITCRAAN